MNPELQPLLDRLAAVERQNRTWRGLGLFSLLVAIAALAVAILFSQRRPEEQARYSVVEANRFLLRDFEGNVAGGMEVNPEGTIKLVLGGEYGETGAAFLEVQTNGVAHLTLRGPDGGVRAAVLGTRTPSISLSPEGERSSAALMTLEDGSGSIFLTDARGRTRFKAP